MHKKLKCFEVLINLNDKTVEYVESILYLGVVINNKLEGDLKIKKHMC